MLLEQDGIGILQLYFVLFGLPANYGLYVLVIMTANCFLFGFSVSFPLGQGSYFFSRNAGQPMLIVFNCPRRFQNYRSTAVGEDDALAFVDSSSSLVDICNDRSCYPATGNLLIGRENRLTASSTCGLLHPERYCIVSHLEDRKKCFTCNSRQPWARYVNERSHRIENVVSDRFEMRAKKWWQSENGLQNVTVRLDLEAEFHFTHLIMTFKSFRPAAMIIERSSDFGKTWKIYRYFAYDCAESFPGVPEGIPRRHTDVICDSRYSFVAPSTGGEVVFKVLSPHIALEDPYSEEIQDLLRVTNLRINFTKLHTLGDNLLDNRPEITEKYYYAVYEMVVRGSCSCYGHASRCKPIDDDGVVLFGSTRPDMVHGRCECTHHTKGLNCEECEDFYNDLPWKPAIDRETNACKRCNCNEHANRCHFDHAVYEASGFVSGGVCDDCQHNTMGKNCEMCKPYFYRDPDRALTDPYVCRACECDLRGSLNQGICESETDSERNLISGRCHCKVHVVGDHCDACKNGYWNLDQDNPEGCTACTCNLLGTVNNEGCDKRTGECTCKRLVTGDNCDRCLLEHYGLSEQLDGCKPCDCDIGGAYDNSCDVMNGQCRCRAHFSGRRCDIPESGYYCAGLDFFTYEAEEAVFEGPAEVELREPYWDATEPKQWTGSGFVRVRESSVLNFAVHNIHVAMDYNVVLRYESPMPSTWQNVRIDVIRPSPPDSTGPCANSLPKDDFMQQVSLKAGERIYDSVQTVCLEPNVQYHIRVTFGEYQQTGRPDRTAALLIDSLVLMPSSAAIGMFMDGPALSDERRREFDHFNCRRLAMQLTPVDQLPEPCRRQFCPVAASILDRGVACDCNPTGSVSGMCDQLGGQCQCKQNVLGRRCDVCAAGTFGFGPQGCRSCDCNSIGALDNFCDSNSGQCKCREAVHGRQCDQCQPGYWGFPDCRPCQCNGHANVCDQRTGACVDCRDLTAGHHCEQCQLGYYGDPRLGVSIPCRPCPCPGGPGSGFQHADSCYLDAVSESVVCNCRHGYEGERCDRCITNYWGNPNELGGSCERCDCNGNIDFDVPGSCDQKTGRCLKCTSNTDGYQCEHCMAGFYGDAQTQSCTKCVCNILGTDITAGPCDRITGQCPCLPNVVGRECDACASGHWKIASGRGCESCDCDEQGVEVDNDQRPLLQCNEFDGQCPCKPGRGGRTCGECENYYWGDPSTGCVRCQCNSIGSETLQCHRANGSCVCLPGSGGPNCDQCARGHTGTWPQCEPCGECFQNWDSILQELQQQTDDLAHNATQLADTGVSFVYDDQFNGIQTKLRSIENQLSQANISSDLLDQLHLQVGRLQARVDQLLAQLNAVDSRSTGLTAGVDTGHEHLRSLQQQAADLEQSVLDLERNVTDLRQRDPRGAYNVTREAAQLSLRARQLADATERVVAESEAERRRTRDLLDANARDFDHQFKQNQNALDELDRRLVHLEARLPDLNRQICGARTDGGEPCDDLCGGAGCSRCGGASCRDGSATKAERAWQYSREATDKLEHKQRQANELTLKLRHAQADSDMALIDAGQAFETAVRVAQVANDTRAVLGTLLDRAAGLLNRDAQATAATPDQIRLLAEQVLNMTISLDKRRIETLADQIGDNLKKLTNIQAILHDTRQHSTEAQLLKNRADQSKVRIETVEKTAQDVMKALNDSKHFQTIAKQAILSANENFDQTNQDLKAIAETTETAEQIVNASVELLASLREDLKKVEVEYLQIGKDVERALVVSESARQKTEQVEVKRKTLEQQYKEAENLLNEKIGDNEAARQRAEQLRQTATKLLEKTEKHLSDIEELRKIVSVNEVTMSDVENRLAGLLSTVEAATDSIQYYLKAYDHCSCPSSEDSVVDLEQERKALDANELRLAAFSKTLQQLNSRLEHCTAHIEERTKFYEHCD
ncbi:Laminin subunit beta-1 [Trichinella murrelli]|uniref:Laminin subunit beta-1 n=1 Tax=Trichinella murrelli TaxID=144512 RepID=A0A0V0TNM5_9BILA|nr:Laminin subunit beta-1 [Trichinella murrelli]